MKILVVRFSSIGDIVLTTPVVRALKQQLGAEVHYLTKKGFARIAESNPYIDRVWAIEKDLADVLPALQKEQFDCVVDLHKNWRTLRVKWSLGVKSYAFQKLNFKKWLLTRLKINRLPDVHIVDRYLAAVQPLGVQNDGLGLDYFIPEKDRVDVGALSTGVLRSGQYVAFAVGAAHFTKRIPERKIIEWLARIDAPVALLGGPGDSAAGERIAAAGGRVFNLCGRLNLNQSASVIEQAGAVVSPDTGLMHIAAAFSKKIYSVWGNTVPEFGMYPYYPAGIADEKSVILEVKGLSCRPCSKIGFDACPKGHFKCMELQVLPEITFMHY